MLRYSAGHKVLHYPGLVKQVTPSVAGRTPQPAPMESSPACTTLLDVRLHKVLEQRLLPLLPAVSLGRLGCTCRDLHALVAALDVPFWRAAALHTLPARHPALEPGQEPAYMLAAVGQHARAQHNMRAGVWSYSPAVRGADMPRFPPAGIHTGLRPSLQVYDTQVASVTPDTRLGVHEMEQWRHDDGSQSQPSCATSCKRFLRSLQHAKQHSLHSCFALPCICTSTAFVCLALVLQKIRTCVRADPTADPTDPVPLPYRHESVAQPAAP